MFSAFLKNDYSDEFVNLFATDGPKRRIHCFHCCRPQGVKALLLFNVFLCFKSSSPNIILHYASKKKLHGLIKIKITWISLPLPSQIHVTISEWLTLSQKLHGLIKRLILHTRHSVHHRGHRGETLSSNYKQNLTHTSEHTSLQITLGGGGGIYKKERE